MKQLKITRHSLSKICRLCLRHDVTVTCIFSFSSKLEKEIADIIMNCAPVQITKHDEMPTCICELCYKKIEEIHEFQMQVLQSERMLRQYIQQLQSSEKQTKPDCLTQDSSKDVGNQKPHLNEEFTIKCESLGIKDTSDGNISRWKVKSPDNLEILNKDMPLKFEEVYNVHYKEELSNHLNFQNLYVKSESSNIKEELPVKSEVYNVQFEKESNIQLNVTNLCKNSKYLDGREDTGNTKLALENIHSIEDENSTKSLDKITYINKKSSIKKKTHQCDTCKDSFKNLSALSNHKLIHTEENPYQCDICKMYFRGRGHLKRHKLVHTGEKPYQCDVCQMFFRELGHLKKHQLIHTGEKPYQCDVCKMCFRHSNRFKTHKLKHTGEKPYPCDVCKQSFRELSNLKKHKLTHTGEKPYRCDVCNKCFRDRSNFKRHKLIHGSNYATVIGFEI